MEANGLDRMPLFPLGTVLFPTNVLPLRIFEPRYVDLVGRCMRDGSGFGIVGIREGREVSDAAVPYDTGTLARIIDFDRGGDGFLNIVVQGGERFRITETSRQDDNLLVAAIELIPDIVDVPVPDDFHSLSRLLDEILTQTEAAGSETARPDTAAALAYALAQYLPLDVGTKVAMLESGAPVELLIRLANEVRRLRQKADSS